MGRQEARRCDPGHVAGCMLYGAEGSKSRNTVKFVNSDPAILRFFVEFVRAHYAVPDDAFRLDCNLFADHVDHQDEIEQRIVQSIYGSIQEYAGFERPEWLG
jgi:hypothetical protein